MIKGKIFNEVKDTINHWQKRITLIKAAPKSKNVADAPGNVEGMDVANPCNLIFKLVASMSTFAIDAFCNIGTLR